MGTFLQARRAHRAVAIAADQDAASAGDLWNAIVGAGSQPLAGSFAEAVQDTAPVEHAALLASDDVAAAYAFERLWGCLPALPPRASPFELRGVAREAWAAFDAQARRTEHLADGFGWDVSSAWTHARDVELAHGDLHQVERIARLAGRMYAALRGARANRVQGVPAEVYSVEQGNDVSRLLPAEQVLLMEPVLETVVLERIASRRAAQYAVRGEAMKSKGPLVIALDESGSMHAARNEWAKAATVALCRVAFDEKRPVAVVHYSTSTAVQAIVPGDTEAVLRMVRHFLGGGTAIGLALGMAVQQVRQLARRGHQGADIILVTDGVDGDQAAQEAALREGLALGVRLWTVAIECEVPETSPLRAKAAHYMRLGGAELAKGESVSLLAGAT
ncbi:VWA domain-containing protein [Sorangium sp. So ce327]|uniref:vWA domain-containing protein n=1 Tax=Sorangium sp. So ce327 TaxID=3133301 RepID=UPI003F5F64D9